MYVLINIDCLYIFKPFKRDFYYQKLIATNNYAKYIVKLNSFDYCYFFLNFLQFQDFNTVATNLKT